MRAVLWRCLAVFLQGLGLVACVPEGPSTRAERDESLADESETEDATGAPTLKAPFRDEFERNKLGPDYNTLSTQWAIEDGWLCVDGAANQGAWLRKRLPKNVRIEFDAVALTDEGDIKVEIFGDGVSGATAASYSNATSYIAIFGGWNNTSHVLARLDEHGSDRKQIAVDAVNDDPRARSVVPGQVYHFKFERKHGSILSWWIDGAPFLEFKDEAPLVGPGHEHFGFNDWSASVCFDNLEITPL